MNPRWLVLLLAVAVASAQLVEEDNSPSGFGAAKGPRHVQQIGGPALPPPAEPVQILGGGDFAGQVVIGGRKLLSHRALKGVDGDSDLGNQQVVINATANVYSRIGRHCPINPPTDGLWANFDRYANYTQWAMYGDLVHDNFICDLSQNGYGKVAVTGNSSGVFYGGAAQDFGTARPLWESYGWSLFKLKNPPAASNLDHVKIQGLTLHVIGNVGTKHPAGVNCNIKGVSVAIFNAAQTSPYDPTARNYSKYIDLSQNNAETFVWSTNKTAALYVDIGTFPDTYPRFANSTYHWLRVKLHADYGGANGQGQCFAFWGVSSAIGNDVSAKSRWQERIGGASGYSTTCIGAASSGNITQGIITTGANMNTPGQYQTWWNCWNNGLNTQAGDTGRRCSTYRATVNPNIPSTDCISATRAQFNDYNYAFTGIQGQAGVGEEPGQGGLGGAR